MDSTLLPEVVTRVVSFHGQQLYKLWEPEFSSLNINIKEPDFAVYQERQKHLSFQDRGKRLKLHQFIVKKAAALYDPSALKKIETDEKVNIEDGYFALMPPLEAFMNLEKEDKIRRFFEIIKPGDIIIGSIMTKMINGMMLKVICTGGEFARYVGDYNIKAFCATANVIPAVDKKNLNRNYLTNDLVCCEILEVNPDADRLMCGMKGTTLPAGSEYLSRLGLFSSEDLPEPVKMQQELKGEHYEDVLEKSLGFYNPTNIGYLASHLGLGSLNHSYMTGLRGRFPEQDYATELRQVQASKWAFRNVAEGIEHFKSGRHSEAFQCLNQALNTDPRNVEGLVARGALFANSGSFQKAIEDFETALKLNPNHQNASKYMGETLVALGRSYEDENKIDEALKSYEDCLRVIPFHEEAKNSIEYLKTKALTSNKVLDEAIPGLSSSKTFEVKETLKQLLKTEDGDEKKDKEKSKGKKKKEKKRKRRHHSSSSSSSSSASSSSSSTSSSSDSSSGSSDSNSSSPRRRKSKKHKKSSRKKEEKRERSLSPLSKRMLMDTVTDGGGLSGLASQRTAHYNPPALPFSFTRSSGFQLPPDDAKHYGNKDGEYEQCVYRFIEQTKGDSDYEEKVRKFLEESVRWKKERKAQEEKAKKKRKKEKKEKTKDKGKKKKKDRDDHDKKKKHRSKKDKSEMKDFEEQMESKKFREVLRKELQGKVDSRKRKSIDEEDDEEYLYGPDAEKKETRMLGFQNLPGFDDLESKLSAYYAKVEKDGILKSQEERGGRERKRPSQSPAKSKTSPNIPIIRAEDMKKELDELSAREKKKMDMFADSPSPSPVRDRNKASSESGKWKSQSGISGISRIKKKEKPSVEREPWEEIEEKRFIFLKDDEGGFEDEKHDSEIEEGEVRKRTPQEKVPRKIMRGESMSEKILAENKKNDSRDFTDDAEDKSQHFLDNGDKYLRNSKGLDDLPPLPAGAAPKTSFTIQPRKTLQSVGGGLSGEAFPKGPHTDSESGSSDEDRKKKKSGSARGALRSRSKSPRRSRASSKSSSRSRSYTKNRSRSKSGSYGRRRSRSGSYNRSRSRSYGKYSRSRSRSRSFHSRSRSYDRYSRSRSRSDDHYRRRSRSGSDDRRRRYDYMNKYQGRYPRNRGTYYRPRFQNYNKNPQQRYNQRGRMYNKNYPQNRNRPYGNMRNRINRPGGSGGRGNRDRYYQYKGSGYRDYHSRRYESRRSRDRDSRSYSRDDDDDDTMKKVDAAKEKINKYIEEKRNESPTPPKRELSEGEAEDDDLPPLPPGGPPPRDSLFVDRKASEGKWTEDDDKEDQNNSSEMPKLPSECSIEEMDKFLNKVKTQKKEDMKKSFAKGDW